MSPLRREIAAQLRLALPVVTVQLGLMAMGVVDTAMMGRVSAEGLAAVAIGNVWSFGAIAFGLGTLQALDPVISQAFGARDRTALARGFQRGIVLCGLLTVPVGLAIAPVHVGLQLLGQPPEVVPLASTYAWITIASVPSFLLFVALRQGLQAMHLMRPLVLAILATNVLNVVLDYGLIFGRLGLPRLEVSGCAWATVISRWAQAGVLLALAWSELRPHLLPVRRDAFAWKPLARVLRLGAPIGAQFFFEIGAFGAIALLMGRLGATEIAGHQIALNLVALFFMIPLGISMAASVRVGNEVGRGDPAAVRRAAKVALAGATGIMLLSAALFALFPEPLARIYSDKPGVVAAAAMLLPVAAVFQISDGTQVVASGLLRGVGDTRFPMVSHLVGFWLVGIPLAWLLAFEAGAGPRGLWWGLVAGLTATGLVLLLRVRARLSRALERLRFDEDELAPAPPSTAPGGDACASPPPAENPARR